MSKRLIVILFKDILSDYKNRQFLKIMIFPKKGNYYCPKGACNSAPPYVPAAFGSTSSIGSSVIINSV